MGSHPLDGVMAKLSRAKHHAVHIQTALNSWRSAVREGKHGVAKMRPNGKGFEMAISEPPPLDPALPLMVGDYVHNIRSSLDHLVAQLSVQAGHAIGLTRHLNFPVYKSETLYLKDYRHKLIKLVCPEALTAIERSQPYQAKHQGIDPATDPLWILAELDNIDKHRVLVVVAKKFRKKGARFFPHRGARPIDIPIRDDPWWPMEDGTTVTHVDLSFSGPHRPSEVGVEVDMTASVQFANTGLCCDGMTLDYVLPKLFNRVATLVKEFNRVFFP
jgi:hypothetical protein